MIFMRLQRILYLQVKETLDYTSYVAPECAELLLRALRPLMKQTGSDLKDYAVLVLRKAIFSRECNARRISVNGFLSLVDATQYKGTSLITNLLLVFSFNCSCICAGSNF